MPRKPRFGSIYRRKKKLPDGAEVTLKPWWIQYRVTGKKVRESSKSTRYGDAERLLRQRLREVDTGSYAGPVAERIRVADLLDDLIADFELNAKSVEWVRYVDGHLRPFFGKLKASSVGTRQISEYIKFRREQGVSNSTVNRELGRLRRAFNLAREATPPTVMRVPRIPKLEEAPPREGFFEHEEFLAMRPRLPEDLRLVITFAYYTGCRKGEILGLRWLQVEFVERVVRLEPGETKNGEAREIPLVGELYDMLVLQREIRDQRWPECPWVFFRHGKPIKDFREAWDQAAEGAGLWDADRARPTKLFHDLRRTGVRNLVRAGVPERVAMAISGHKTRSVFDRYNIVSRRDLHLAAARLEQHISKLERGQTGHTLGTLGKTEKSVSEGVDRKLLN